MSIIYKAYKNISKYKFGNKTLMTGNLTNSVTGFVADALVGKQTRKHRNFQRM